MRYEAKNKYFKSLATRLGNFINLPYSLTMHHQQLQCYYNLNMEVVGHELEVGPGDTVSADILQNFGMSLLSTEIPCRYISSVVPLIVFIALLMLPGIYSYMFYYYYRGGQANWDTEPMQQRAV